MKYRVLIIFIFVLLITGCSFLGNQITEITIVGDDFIEVGEGKFVYIDSDSKKDLDIIFTSSDESILNVEEDGFVLGVSEGVATITATLKDNEEISDSLEITVTLAEPENMFIQGSSSIYVNSNLKLNVFTNPTHASKEVIWESDDTSVATVNEEGVVTGINMGIVEIKATSLINPNVVAKHRLTILPDSTSEFVVKGPRVVELDDEVLFVAMTNDIDVTQHFNWVVSDPEIATINSVGLFRPLKAGKVTLTVTSKFDSNLKQELTIDIVAPEYKYVKTKVLTIDRSRNYVEFLNVSATQVTRETRYLKLDGSKMGSGSLNDLYVGMENVYVEYRVGKEEIEAILIDGEPGYSNIRVGIRKSIADISDDSTRFHNDIKLFLFRNAEIKTFDGLTSTFVNAPTEINITIENGKMIVKNGNQTVLESSKRIIIVPSVQEEAIRIDNISRGSNRIYSGNLEVSLFLGKMLLVNDINLEHYLYKVVPSEMPASYNVEALKAQAIAARTYAYKDILNRSFEFYGYTVDDSVQSQVYNNGNQHSNTNGAVNDTKGLIMMHDGELVNAFYYSTSAGITASAHEVWIDNGNTNPAIIPYLIGQNHTTDANGQTIEFDYTDEANMLEFYKRINVVTPDNTVGFHRRKVVFTKEQLTRTISNNLTLRYAQTPNLILTKIGSNFISRPISNDIGNVERVYVGERGSSGVVKSLIVETTTNTYKIVNQYNIRFTLRPGEAGTTNQTATAASSSYTPTSNNSIMFSGFFAIEEVNNTFVFYGGGNGHGVGMSQNGANTLGKNGMKFDEILNSYYNDIDLIDITYEYEELEHFKDYFFLDK